MGNMYPYIEFVKVIAAYVTLLYIWPSVVFYKYLKGKGMTFRFLFCSTVQIVLINSIVLGLGLFQILNVWLVRGLFFGAFIFSMGNLLCQQIRQEKSVVESVQVEYCCGKVFFEQILRSAVKKGKKLWYFYKESLTEYLLLIVILLFGMIYFSIGQLQDYTYGHYDQYIHFQWILDLKQGKIFSDGIYPEAMHCFIYCMHCLFGVKLYSIVLLLSGIHISAFLLAAYCLLQEVFQQHFMPLFVLTAWLTYDAGMKGMALARLYSSISRLAWMLPQEFGMYLVFLCPLFLLRFFRIREDELEARQWYRNENLFFLMLGVGAALSTHFYVIILAFFMCLAVVIVYLRKVLLPKNVFSLMHAVINGISIGALPMILAYIMGVQLQGSLRWGMKIYSGESEGDVSYTAESSAPIQNRNVIKDIYEKGFVDIFGEQGAVVFIAILVLIILFVCGRSLYLCKVHKAGQNEQITVGRTEGYLAMVVATIIYIVLYVAPFIGLPEFVVIGRIISILKMLIFIVPGVLADFVLVPMILQKCKLNVRQVAFFGCVAIYCFAYLTDFHKYPYSYLKHYKAAVLTTDKIMDKFNRNTYKIVSMDDEKGQVEKEKREELFIFLQNINKTEYYLPVEYIFLFVEKHPVIQGQIHFYNGPRWIADKSSLFQATSDNQSQCPDILHSEISREMSQQEITDYSAMEWHYWDTTLRTVVSSKAYYWYRDFSNKYSEESSVYYEDDDFVCYMIHQDPEKPLNLAIDKE